MQTFQVKCMAEKYFIQSSYFKPLDIRKSFSRQFGVRYSIKNCIETLKNIHFWKVGNDKTYNLIPIYLAMKMPQKSDWFTCCWFYLIVVCFQFSGDARITRAQAARMKEENEKDEGIVKEDKENEEGDEKTDGNGEEKVDTSHEDTDETDSEAKNAVTTGSP